MCRQEDAQESVEEKCFVKKKHGPRVATRRPPYLTIQCLTPTEAVYKTKQNNLSVYKQKENIPTVPARTGQCMQ